MMRLYFLIFRHAALFLFIIDIFMLTLCCLFSYFLYFDARLIYDILLMISYCARCYWHLRKYKCHYSAMLYHAMPLYADAISCLYYISLLHFIVICFAMLATYTYFFVLIYAAIVPPCRHFLMIISPRACFIAISLICCAGSDIIPAYFIICYYFCFSFILYSP